MFLIYVYGLTLKDAGSGVLQLLREEIQEVIAKAALIQMPDELIEVYFPGELATTSDLPVLIRGEVSTLMGTELLGFFADMIAAVVEERIIDRRIIVDIDCRVGGRGCAAPSLKTRVKRW